METETVKCEGCGVEIGADVETCGTCNQKREVVKAKAPKAEPVKAKPKPKKGKK